MGSDWGRRIRGRTGGRIGSRTGDRTGGRTEGRIGGVGLEGSDWGGQTGGGRTGGRTRGRTREVGLGSDEVVDKISQVSLRFADMSSDVDVIHPTCPSLDKVKFGSGKVTSWSVTVTAEVVTTS